jgi:uncharacterized protein YndB with AHSA1/START domain
VLQSDRPGILSITFESPSDDHPPTTVTFALEPHNDIVRLTIVHTGFPTADARQIAAHGWAAVAANLKTYLESGHPLPQPPWEL